MTWIYLISAGILSAFSNISIKHGLTQISAFIPEVSPVWQRIPYWAGNLFIWLGLLGLGTAFICYLMGLSHVKLNTAYPILVGLEYSLVMLLSWLVLGEAMALTKIAGITLVFIGIVFITY